MLCGFTACCCWASSPFVDTFIQGNSQEPSSCPKDSIWKTSFPLWFQKSFISRAKFNINFKISCNTYWKLGHSFGNVRTVLITKCNIYCYDPKICHIVCFHAINVSLHSNVECSPCMTILPFSPATAMSTVISRWRWYTHFWASGIGLSLSMALWALRHSEPVP